MTARARGKQRTAPRRERLPAETRIRVWQRFKGVCQHCFREVSPWAFDVDHRKPVAHGGSSVISNLIPCHQVCNRRRGTRTLAEWRAVLRAERQSPPNRKRDNTITDTCSELRNPVYRRRWHHDA